MPHIYRHIRLDKNEPFYVGIGLDDIPKRAYETKKRRSQWWNNIVNKYGYSVDILFENVTIDFAKEKEKEFISLYGRIDLGTGTLCNQTNGGDGINGWKATPETKLKMSESAKIRGTAMLNTPEIIEKRANSMRGKKRTPIQCERLAAWQRGIPKHKEQIEKMRATKLLQENVEKSRNQPNCKKVLCLDNGVIYRSFAEAGRQLNVERSAISMCCLGKRDNAKGLKFIYALEQRIKELENK
jgi:hypothetical protein